MLVLIVGVTGNIGLKLARGLVRRGHQVRGASRSKAKVPEADLQTFESFHEISSWYDVTALRQAVRGVDAVVCAYTPLPTLALEGELLLVRIMEEEGVTRFVPCAWNLDWSKLPWGAVPYYDNFLALRRQLELSSTVKPLYISVGILGEAFFSVAGHGGFAPEHKGVWDPVAKKALVWGTGDEKWQITTEYDTAEFTAELVTDLRQESGDFRFCSFEQSTREMAKAYETFRGVTVTLDHAGSLEKLKEIAKQTARELGDKNSRSWMGYYFQMYQLDGTAYMKDLDNKLYPSLKTTSLLEFLRTNPDV